MTEDKLTEREIQYRLWYYRACISSNLFVVPNASIWYWEADLIHVTPSGFATEWEIKLSRSDYRADFKKQFKHQILSGEHQPDCGPKYFYYACPAGLIRPNELPKYAGLFYIYDGHELPRLIIPAPRRKVKPMTDKQKIRLYEKGLRRYWSTQEKHFMRRTNESI
jgi:hypothetical protein